MTSAIVHEEALRRMNQLRDSFDADGVSLDLITADPGDDLGTFGYADIAASLLGSPQAVATAHWDSPAIESGRAVMRNSNGYTFSDDCTAYGSVMHTGGALCRIDVFAGGPRTVSGGDPLEIGTATRPFVERGRGE